MITICSWLVVVQAGLEHRNGHCYGAKSSDHEDIWKSLLLVLSAAISQKNSLVLWLSLPALFHDARGIWLECQWAKIRLGTLLQVIDKEVHRLAHPHTGFLEEQELEWQFKGRATFIDPHLEVDGRKNLQPASWLPLVVVLLSQILPGLENNNTMKYFI